MRIPSTSSTHLTLALLAGALAAACGDAEPVTDEPPVDQPPVVEPPVEPPPAPECQVNADCGDEAAPYCDASGSCAPPPIGGAIGWGEGTPQSVGFETVHVAMFAEAEQSTDLAFSPLNPNEMWVLHRYAPNDQPCLRNGLRTGCAALRGSTTTVFDVGLETQSERWVMDYNAWHFMRRPPAIAFGVDGFFATCGEARTGNFLDPGGADFMGPSLWTSDPSIYQNYTPATIPSLANGQPWNGSHMDMLHATPFCMGIAHDRGNAYWVANGNVGSLDHYDFKADHGPGEADHSDGEIRRYVPGTLTRVPNVPGHLAVHEGKVYAADTGGGRIVVLDPSGAAPAGPIVPQYEPLALSQTLSGGTVSELVPPGSGLVQPSGLEIHDGVVYVSDHQTSEIHAFDLEGQLLRSLRTGLPPGSLGGIAINPADGKMYFVDIPSAAVVRIDPNP